MTDALSSPESVGLARSLLPRHVAMISIGGIIGAGLFVGSSAAIALAGPAVLLSYGLAGLTVLFVMRMLSEMASAHPGIGAFTEFARLGLGNWAGFTCGWLYWYFWVVVVAIEAIAGAVIIQSWIPVPVWLIGILLMLVLTATNLVSTRSYGEFEFWFASLKVAAIIAFIIVGLGAVLGGNTGNPGLAFMRDVNSFAPAGWGAVLGAVTSVIFSLCGAEIATIAAAESSAPAKAIARLTGQVIMRILLFYVVSIALILVLVPWTDIVPGVSPFVTAMDAVGIPGASLVLEFVILVAVLSCLNSGLYVTSRILLTLAGRGEAPQMLVALNRRRVPIRAIIFGSIFAYGAVIASIMSPSLVFAFLVNASGAIMLFIYMIVAIAQLRLRPALDHADSRKINLRMWLHPWLGYLTVLAILAILIAMAFSPETAVQFQATAVAIVGALAAYFLMARRQRLAIKHSIEG